jgi:ATP-binding cassette, subfamily C, bacterial
MKTSLVKTPLYVNPLVKALEDCKSAFIITFIFSFGVNLLNLITPLFALQVLDRVLSSGNKNTLLMLSLIFFFVYLAHTLLQVARSFTLIKVGEWLDKRISPILFSHAVSTAAIRPSLGASQSIREFATIKSFLTSIGINSLFDAPWSFIYITVVFLIHPFLGWLTIFGALLMLFMAFLNAYAINSSLSDSNECNLKGHHMAELATRNAETVQAMGMMKKVQRRWLALNEKALGLQSVASYRNGIIANSTRFFRAIIQMAVTGIGAYIVVTSNGQDMTAGNMIASSIIVGRALAPFDQAIEVWKQVTSASKSYKKIKSSFDREGLKTEGMSIPNPHGQMTGENIFFAPPPSMPGEQPKYTLRGLNFTLEAGKSLAIIGPSAAGKSTLARLLVGVWKPTSGHVRLDGMDVFSWNREDFGKHVGYLPQGIELFSGTIKDNISRMCTDPDTESIIEASKLSGAHDMVSRLPNGYETDIGIAGSFLSGGQRQRVGLARAFYGKPKIVVLDEPNANLDEKGEQGLVDALANAKKKNITTILISHRPSILAFVDMIMILQDGMIAAYGPKDEIMARFTQAAKEQKADSDKPEKKEEEKK